MSGDVAVVLADGDYLQGAGVLFNSLHRRGFQGTFVVASSGARPRWWPEAEGGSVTGGARLVWLELPVGGLAARWKPWAMLRALEAQPAAERWYLFDADQVAKAPWFWFQRWVEEGLAVVEDLFGGGRLLAEHPWRRWWGGWLTQQGATVLRPGGVYANSGFLAGRREHAGVLQRWVHWIQALEVAGVPLDSLRLSLADPRRWTGPGARFMDQDALNLALMTGAEPLAPMEPAAMDLGRGGEVLSHAVGMDKPWRMQPWREAWRGTPPAEAQRTYWQEALGVLPVWSEAEVRRWQRDLAAAYAWTRWPLGLKVAPQAVAGLLRERRRARREG